MSSASSRSAARDAAPAMPATPRATHPIAATAPAPAESGGFYFAAVGSEDQFKLNLSDIPRLPSTMDVEGFKPSLLVRLVGLIAGSR